MGKISLVKTDGSGYKELEAGDGLTAVALGDMPIWMTVGGNVNTAGGDMLQPTFKT